VAFDIDSSVIFPLGAATRTTPEIAARKTYDVVIVGGGVSGSILASQLSQAGQGRPAR
jgi:alkyl hydroperoxide reductase subunit AhpF